MGGSADHYAGPAGGEPLAEEMGLFWCGWIAAGVGWGLGWGGMATDLLVVHPGNGSAG